MDASDFGRYGTLYLLKRHDPDAIVAPYPIDEPELTLGLHCRVVFNDEGKAFVVVLGTNGLLIDDCPCYPSASGTAPTTVPLPNNSVLEVHKKRFRFAYPPRHLRTALAAIPSTPTASPGTRHRALRMSMITSAKVFSPRPFEDPQRNLEVLQSPLKASFKPEPEDDENSDDEGERENAAGESQNENGESEEIVLVESDHPRVVESEKDLIILDHVTVTEPPPSAAPSPYRASTYTSPAHAGYAHPSASPLRANQMPVPPQNWTPPRTPGRRVPRASLHRAVLIRSAHRAALRHEMQREEEMDAEEVESIMGEEADENDGHVMEDVEEYEEQEVEVKEEEEQQQRRTPMSGWRKSLEAVKGGLGWAFRAASVEAEDIPRGEPQFSTETSDEAHDEAHDKEAHDEDTTNEREEDYYAGIENEDQGYMVTDDMENTENIYPSLRDELLHQPEAGPSTPEPSAAPLRPLGRFLTPQVSSAFPRPSAQGRNSVGGFAPGLGSSVSGTGAGPRRVRLVEPWKVSDIVVPTIAEDVKKEEENVKQERAQSMGPGASVAGTPRRDRVSVEEKRAIRERRKSALKTPDNFFNGQVPGFRRTSAVSSAPLPALFPTAQNTSPTKEHGAADKSEDGAVAEAEDAGVLLARMRQMVEGVKRRQSMEAGAGETPRSKSLSPKKRSGFSLLAREPGEQYRGEDVIMEEPEDVDDPAGKDSGTVLVSEGRRQAGTPQMNDLRHLFAAPESSATPQLAGVREMFLREKKTAGLEGAALEGVEEMMSTPAGWRTKASAHMQEGIWEDDGHAEEETAPVAPSRVSKGTGAISKRTPRSAAARKETPASSLAPVDEDEVAASARDRPAARVVRRTRTRTAESDQETSGTSAPRGTRSRHARTEEDDEVPELPTRTKSTTRRRAGAGSDASEDEAGASSKPVRRSTRTASAEPEAARMTLAGAAASARRTRVTRTPVPEEPAAPVPKPSTARRGARRKVTEAAASENEDDPLDSLTPEEPPHAAARVRRTARSRIPTGTVKEEDESPAVIPTSSDEHAVPAARAVRGRKAAGTSKVTASTSATRSGTRSRPGASVKKTTAEAPASGKSTPTTGEEESGDAGDKENTPEPQTEDDAPAGATATKGKGKSTAASSAKAKTTRSAAKVRGRTEEPVAQNADGGAKSIPRASRKRVTMAGKS